MLQPVNPLLFSDTDHYDKDLYFCMLPATTYAKEEKVTEDLSMKNTKKELLEAIHKMQQETALREKSKLNPEKVKTETKIRETTKKAEEISESGTAHQRL